MPALGGTGGTGGRSTHPLPINTPQSPTRRTPAPGGTGGPGGRSTHPLPVNTPQTYDARAYARNTAADPSGRRVGVPPAPPGPRAGVLSRGTVGGPPGPLPPGCNLTAMPV